MTDPLVAAFDRIVAASPARLLLVSPGHRPVTVGDVDALARGLSARLAKAGIRPGRLVGLQCGNGAGFLAAIVALRRSGAAVLLLDPLGPQANTRRTARALGASASLGGNRPGDMHPDALSLEVFEPRPQRNPLPPNTAFVKVTSGSTGGPRGVAVTTEAMLADEAALASTMAVNENDRLVAAVPMSHSYGFASVAMPALVRGCLLVVPDPAAPLSPLLASREAEATAFFTVPAYLQAVLKMSQPPRWPDSIRLVVSAGAPLSPETAGRFHEVHGRRVHTFYGASECGGIAFDREGGAAERGAVGTAVDGVRIVLDPTDDASEGIVSVTSQAVGTTYVPEADERLAEGRFRTNDVARWSGGELKVLRRIDALINVRGRKVDPAEIESTLASLGGVDEVVALGIPDHETGGHTVRVVIACRPGRLTYEQVLGFCQSRLAGHKVPRSIKLVPEIPRTARGKIDRGVLTEN